jgi:hypothetical protein
MKRFIEGSDRGQWTLLPECLGDWIDESNPVAIDAFVEALDLGDLGFEVMPAATGRLLSSFRSAEALHLRLSQSGPLKPPSLTRSWPQS